MNTPENVAPSDVKSRPKSMRGRASFWADEMESSSKFLSQFHRQGNRVVSRYLDERDDNENSFTGLKEFRLNLFNSNVKTLMDMLYSNLPKVEASRSHADANDDAARVAADIIERLINTDIADNGQDYDSVLRASLQDRLLPGLGVARCRYEVETAIVTVEAQVDESGQVITEALEIEQVVSEDAPVDYFHWQDVCWGWARNFSEIPWIGFRSYLSKDEATARFGKELADNLTYKKQKLTDSKDEPSKPDDNSPWHKAAIWEIWDKHEKQVVWWSPGCEKLLDRKADPLGLRGFFPCPPFMIANQTTSLYRPVSDFHICQDLYNEVDTLQTRIAILTTAVKAVGVYDSSDDGVKRMFKEGFENDLVPVDSWAMFAEKGGIAGAVDWLPIEAIVNALDRLTIIRDNTIQLLQKISGMADVMTGALDNQYEGAGQTQIKAQFGSVRVQALQDCFANFAGDLLQIKAEIICKHFQPETIIKMSNMQFSYDKDLLEPAIALLKEPEMAHIRIKVRPEQVAMVDYARLKSDRTEYLNAMATFMQSAAPMLQQQPGSLPFLLQMLQWSMAGFKGSAEIEGVMDKAIEQAQEAAAQAAANPPPDPEQAKMEAQRAANQEKLQGELQKIEAKTQSDIAIRNNDLQADLQTTMGNTKAKLEEIMMNHQANMAEIEAKMRADVLKEQAQGEMNLRQTQATVEGEIQKDVVSHHLSLEESLQEAETEIATDLEKTRLSMIQRQQDTESKLTELMATESVKPKETPDAEDDD